MMKFKKFLAAAMTGAMMLSLVVSAAPAVSSYAITGDDSDETTEGSKFTAEPDYTHYTLELTSPGDDIYAFVEVWKLDSDGSFKSKSNTYSYKLTDKSVTIDLSFLKATAAQGLKVYGDKTVTPFEVTIAAQPSKLSLKYNTASGLFTGKIGKESIPETGLVVGTKKYQYRGQYAAEWEFLEDLDKINHIAAGSTIIVREAATADAPAGPEAKVKIAAIAKAPKVTIDYVKDTISFAKGTEYSIDGITYKEITALKPSSGELRKTFENDGATDLVIFVRTKEDTTKKKAASNVTFITIPALVKPTNDADTSTITVAGSDSKVTYKETEIKGASVYQFTVAGESFDFSTDDGKTWKTVKDKGTFNVTMSNETQTVSVRKTGVKANTKTDTLGSFATDGLEITVPAIKSTTEEEKDSDGDNL